MFHSTKILISLLISFSLLFSSFPLSTAAAASKDSFSFIILSQYKAKLDIGEEIYLLAITSNGKQPTWKSSNSKVASVNTYGVVTAKKSGSAVITAKITNTEASCHITVRKTEITISAVKASIERGETYQLTAQTSNHSEVTWKSSKKSIATIDEYGLVTGKKPGETTITASSDGSEKTCILTVRTPNIALDKSKITLYKGQSLKLSATVSSKINPVWKTNKKSVAIVDTLGNITAMKHGSATITATVDGVSAICYVTVMKPDITLSSEEITIKRGEAARINAKVSSGNAPVWSSSNDNIASINSYGEITAKQRGKAFVYATEDGTKARCTVYVTD